MSLRDTLLANLSVALSTTSVSVSQELPFSAADIPLYLKNMKKLYVDVDQIIQTELFSVFGIHKLYTAEIVVNAYLTVDAKNALSDIATINNIVQHSRFAVQGAYVRDCEIVTNFVDDKLSYNYIFRFLTI
jgi:hypothetical protein